MKIKNLSLNENDVNPYGLETFNSSKFNTVIALVGKNGSGKTRYLKAIKEKIGNTSLNELLNDEIDFLPEKLLNSVGSLQSFKPVFDAANNLNKIKLELSKDPQNQHLRQNMSKANLSYQSILQSTQFTSKKSLIDNVEKQIKTEINNRIKVINASDIRALKESIENIDQQNVKFQDIVDSTQENIHVDELSTIKSSALTYLRNLPHNLAHDHLHTFGDEKKFKSRVSHKRYLILKKFIFEFLDKELEWTSKTSQIEQQEDGVLTKTSGYWTINGRELNYNDFSDGEKVLFTYAILLFLLNINPRIKFDESIIFIDEPELNLHPKAQIKLIQTISNLIKDKGQLFIATHSLSIVANMEYSSIYLVRNNELKSPSSSVPFESVDDLMGFDEHYNKIVEFLVSTPSWAMTNFMAECFSDPDVFEFADNNDPQVELFEKLLQSESKLNVLDFGSGKGRLLDKIHESNTWNRINNYDCFDVEEKYNDLVKQKGAKAVYNDLKEIPENKYDIVVVVNVLHEIHVEHWVSSINKLKSSLKPNGFIAIIEDTELPIGELPNEHGFLLLGGDEMSHLLGGKVGFMKPTNSRYSDRIICCFALKDNIVSLNKNRLISTLELLKENSLNDIISYRKEKSHELKLGRLYALKANSYVNSELAIKKLK